MKSFATMFPINRNQITYFYDKFLSNRNLIKNALMMTALWTFPIYWNFWCYKVIYRKLNENCWEFDGMRSGDINNKEGKLRKTSYIVIAVNFNESWNHLLFELLRFNVYPLPLKDNKTYIYLIFYRILYDFIVGNIVKFLQINFIFKRL